MILNILNEITALKGKKKVTLLESYKDNIALREIWIFAYTRMNFGTSVMIPLTVGDPTKNPEQGDCQIVALLDKLRNREVTGNAAKLLIQDTLTGLHPDCIEVYNRVIKGNLKCGIGVTAGQSVYGDIFKKYPVMLISPHCNKKAAKIVADGAVMQLKSDGVRGVAENGESNDVKFFSRQGEEFHGLEKFIPQIQELKQQCLDSDGIGSRIDFDGEFCVIQNSVHMPSIASGIMNSCIHGTATQEEIDQLTFMVWDLIDHEYLADEDDIYGERLATLEDVFEVNRFPNVDLIEGWRVTSLDEVHAKYAEIVKSGNEGVVLKSLLNLWADKRVTDCIKYKEKHRAEFRIKAWYYGDTGGEFQNVLGGYEISSEDGKVLSNTGSGLSFAERGILMDTSGKKPKALKGTDGNYLLDPDFDFEEKVDSIVSIEYNQRSKSKDGRETYSLRFPIVKQFRCDKIEANTLEEMIAEEGSSYGLRLG
jgi:ATP-dependent DNA ligase